MTKRNLLNSGKFIIITLIIIFMGYMIYDQPEHLDTPNKPIESQTNLSPLQSSKSLKDSIVDYGIKLLGVPYVIAGSGKNGFDCSGYVYYVYQHFNINVPRSTSGYENYGTEIPIENVEKGDLLLFLSPTRNAIGHIGIVTSPNGKESDFIHATSGKEMKVITTNLSNEGYTRRFVKAIRVL